MKEVARRLVLGKGLAELLRSPEGGRMCGDGDVQERRTLASLKQTRFIRDEFNRETVDALAKRVGVRCQTLHADGSRQALAPTPSAS